MSYIFGGVLCRKVLFADALLSYLKDLAAVLDNVVKTWKNPYIVGIGGVILVLVEVHFPHYQYA